MAEHVDQVEIIKIIQLVALLRCFRPGEEYLSENQIIFRRFSPCEKYTRNCLDNLISSNALQYQIVREASAMKGASRFLRNPADESPNPHAFVVVGFSRVMNILDKHPGNKLFLLSMRIEVLAYECVEYSKFYSRKSGMELSNESPDTPKLKLMLMELKIGEVNALLWRAIKVLAKHPRQVPIEFDEIIDNAFERYLVARKLGQRLDEYPPPSQLKQSMISRVTEKCLEELPKLSKSARHTGSITLTSLLTLPIALMNQLGTLSGLLTYTC